MATADTDAASNGDDDSGTLFDKLQTAGRIIWAAFLAAVVVLALIPAVALWFGAVPFDPPPARPYFAFVGATLVGTVALIAVAVYEG